MGKFQKSKFYVMLAEEFEEYEDAEERAKEISAHTLRDTQVVGIYETWLSKNEKNIT